MTGVQQVTTTGTQLSVSYLYDIFNRRVEDNTWKASTGTTVTVRHAYDGTNIWADVTTTNTLLARYIYGDGTNQVWARAIPSGLTNAGVAWYLTDREGSVRDIMNASSLIGDHADYDGFGNATHTTLSFADQFGYAGGLYSYDTKMEQFGARWYDPASGRWVSEDPSGFAGGINLNEYVGNNPTNAVDPSGEEPIILPGSVPGLRDGTEPGGGPCWGRQPPPPLPVGDPNAAAVLNRTEWEKWENLIKVGSDTVRVERASEWARSMGVDAAAIDRVVNWIPRIGVDHTSITQQRLADIYKLVLERQALERIASFDGLSAAAIRKATTDQLKVLLEAGTILLSAKKQRVPGEVRGQWQKWYQNGQVTLEQLYENLNEEDVNIILKNLGQKAGRVPHDKNKVIDSIQGSTDALKNAVENYAKDPTPDNLEKLEQAKRQLEEITIAQRRSRQ
jgi:RHS repeat-associated protein